MAEEKTGIKMPHNVIMEDRKRLSVSGVTDVDSFDEKTVIVYTDSGELTVKGDDLHINSLSVESGDLSIEGKISAMIYADEQPRSTGFFSKVFR